MRPCSTARSRSSCSSRVSLPRRLASVAQHLRLWKALQLLQRVALDLADALAGDAEGATDLLQREWLEAGKAVAQLDHLALALRQRIERPADPLPLQVLARLL